jgi:methylase of polypeptide subunit release factors
MFSKSRRVLIPRPETELLVELAWEKAGTVCSISAPERLHCISYRTRDPSRACHCNDQSQSHLKLPRECGAPRCAQRGVSSGNWFDAVRSETYDVIVSNPPM